MRVLFVDDETDVLHSMRRNFGDRFSIVCAESGEEALTLLAETGPADIAVVDMTMPGLDGVDTLRRIGESYPDTVKMMLTGNDDQNTAVKAINTVGVFRFLTKPCPRDKLLAHLDAAVEEAHRRACERLADRQLEQMNETLSLLGGLLWTWDGETDNVRVVPVGTPDSAPGTMLAHLGSQPYSDWIRNCHPEDRSVLSQILRDARHGQRFRQEAQVRLRRTDGRYRWFRFLAQATRFAPVMAAENCASTMATVTAVLVDDHDRICRDAATGLRNAKGLLSDLTHPSRDGAVADVLLMIELDRFAQVQSALGPSQGDAVASRLMGRLERRFGGEGRLYGLGQGTFALLAGVNEPALAAAEALARRVLDAVREPLVTSRREVRLCAWLGYALREAQVMPQQSDDSAAQQTAHAVALLDKAGVALSEAQRTGSGSIQAYSPKLRTSLRRRCELESRLRVAIENDLLEAVYQPIVDLGSGLVVGFEQLARWHDSAFGEVGPNRFIALAEEVGLIGAIGRWSISTACRQLAAWAKGYPNQPMTSLTLNLSGAEIGGEDPGRLILDGLQIYGLPTDAVTVEVTESVTQIPDGLAGMHRFRDLGLKMALDDFGSGFTSLSRLRDLPAETFKIDAGFVAALETDKDARAVVRTIIRLAKALKRNVIAEGVESESQLRILADYGCDMAQGFLFSPPVDPYTAASLAHKRLFTPEGQALRKGA
ncbi:MAG: EAL domain-containing response regulator [Rhodospirillales bacterium]